MVLSFKYLIEMKELCPYRDLFGKVGEGVHSYRIANIAVVDVILTILGAVLLHRIFPSYHFLTILAALFLLGIVLHRLFCVRTTIDRLLFG
jgi:hypothetical protein